MKRVRGDTGRPGVTPHPFRVILMLIFAVLSGGFLRAPRLARAGVVRCLGRLDLA
jgi:hypothetical protein